jgi:hypothetical protein
MLVHLQLHIIMSYWVGGEAATAVIELLMMGGKMPETCRAVNKRQDNKLENCCIWLVIYLNCTMMRGLTNLKNSGNSDATRDIIHSASIPPDIAGIVIRELEMQNDPYSQV